MCGLCTSHGAFGPRLSRFQGLVNGRVANQRRSNLLSDLCADRRELRNTDVLNPAVLDRLRRWVVRVGGQDCLVYHVRERCGLAVLRLLVSRLAGAGRHDRPAFRLRNQLDVVPGRGPPDELLGLVRVLRRHGDCQRPGPQPLLPGRRPGDRGRREGDLVRHLGLAGVGEVSRGAGRVDPHCGLAVGEQGTALVMPVRARPRWAVVLQQTHVEGNRLLPLRRVDLRLPLLVEPAAAVRVHER